MVSQSNGYGVLECLLSAGSLLPHFSLQAPSGVTAVLQWYYSGVTVVLHGCYIGDIVVVQVRYRGVTVALQWCHKSQT
jgi:hypothetical protein